MRWLKKSKRPKCLISMPIPHSIDIILDAYREGLINWNTYNKALAKVESNKNGSWMFEQKEAK